MSRRLQNQFDEDTDEDIDELAYRLRFRHPNDRKRNRFANEEPSPKIRRNKRRYDEAEYD